MYQAGSEAVPGFKLVKRIGAGAFGQVWLATAPGGTQVALKFLRLDSKGEREFYSLRLVKQIRHPNLMPIIAFWLKDEEGNIIADDDYVQAPKAAAALKETASVPSDTRMTLDYSPRDPAELIVAMGLGDYSLYDRLQQCQQQGIGCIPVDELLEYFDQSAQAIDHLNSPIHNLGDGRVAIQHRDVKPQNILIVGGAAQVCDYGLARSLNDVRHTSSLSAAYAAPECFAGEVSAHTDQYALAVSYFEMRTGELPFRDTSLVGVVLQKKEGNLELSRLDEGERAVIRKATSVNPSERYPNCRAMVKALREATTGEKPRKAANKWVTATALVFMIALVAVVAFLVLRRPPVLPEGTEPDEGAELVKAGGRWYYDRIVRPTPNGDRVRLLLIPATLGDDLSSFYIMENKVSNRLFEQFAEAHPESVQDSIWREGPAAAKAQAGIENKDWPVFNVTVAEAHAFAQWLGGRLPSARQWDRAAGLDTESDSPGPYKTPWNPNSKTEIAINRELDGPLPVGSAPNDISPTGCRDMAGNGFEWTRTLMRPFSGYVPREYPNVESPKSENEVDRDMVLLRGQSYIYEQPLQFDTLRDNSKDLPQAAEEPKFDVSFRVVIDVLP